MNYLFGDSTPSQLQIDYIDFLRDALDFGAQVLGANERMRSGEARAAQARKAGDEEVARLEKLGAHVASSIDGADVGAPQSATAQCAEALLRSSADLVRAAIDRVKAQVTGDEAQIETEARRERERCVEALATLLLRHDLPETAKELRLEHRAGGYAARLYLRALVDLQVVLELEIAPAHALAHVVRVDKLIERLEVHAPEAGGWLRKEVKLRPQRLDKEYITGFVSGERETLLQLRAAADGTGVGFDLVLRNDAPRVSLHRVGEASELPPFDLEEADAAKVRELDHKLVGLAADLMPARKALLEAALATTPLADVREPQVIVERLVALMAPVVQEIASRSLTPTELVLKRQTGDGRREEIFVSRRDLQLKLHGLVEASRKVFAPLGLGELPPGEAPPPKAIVEEKPRPPVVVPPPPPAPAAKADDSAVRLDDSLERLIVSSETAGKD